MNPNDLPRWIAFPYHSASESLDPTAARKHAQDLVEAVFEYLGLVAVSFWRSLPTGQQSEAVETAVRQTMTKGMAIGDWAHLLSACCKDQHLRPVILGEQKDKFDSASPVTKFVTSVKGGARQSASPAEFFSACSAVRNQFSHGSAWGPNDRALHAALMAATESFLDAINLCGRLRLVFVVNVKKWRKGQRSGQEVVYKDLRGTGMPRAQSIETGESGLDWLPDALAIWDGGETLIQLPRALATFDAEGVSLRFFQGLDGQRVHWISRDSKQNDAGQPDAAELLEELPCLGRPISPQRAAGPASPTVVAFTASLKAFLSDGEFSASERAALDALRVTLGLDGAEAAAILSAHGVGPAEVALPDPGPASDSPQRPAVSAEDSVRVVAEDFVHPVAQDPAPAIAIAKPHPIWNESNYFADLDARALGADMNILHRSLFTAARSAADGIIWSVHWGVGKSMGSFTFKSAEASLLSAYSGGSISLNLGAWSRVPAATSAALVESLSTLVGFALTDPLCDQQSQYPSIQRALLKFDPEASRMSAWLQRAMTLIAGRDVAGPVPVAPPRAAAATSRKPKYYKLAPGEGAALWPEWTDLGQASIGWAELGDLTQIHDEASFAARLQAIGDTSGRQGGIWQAWTFRNIQIGDYIVANDGTRVVLGIGVVTSTYAYQPPEGFSAARYPQPHRVGVTWELVGATPVNEAGWRRTLAELSEERVMAFREALTEK